MRKQAAIGWVMAFAPAFGAIPLVPLSAQQADTVELTLEQALDIAASNNPAYRRALNQLDVGGAESRAVWMGSVLPSVSLGLTTGYNGNLRERVEDFFGNPIENETSEWIYTSRSNQTLNLGWSIQGSSLMNELRSLDVNDRERELVLETSSREVATAVRRQYFVVLRERDLLDMDRAAREGVAQDRQLVDQRFRFAQATRVDVLNAELALENRDREIRQRERGLEQARLALRTILGDSDMPAFHLAPEPVPIFDPMGLDDDLLVEEALRVHPDVRQQDVSVDQARLAVSDAKNARWPTLGFNYQLGRSTYAGEGSGLFDLAPDDLNNTFSVQLSVPYFSNFFQSRSNEVQAEVGLRNQRETVRETRLQVEQEVRAQLIALRNQYETLLANRRSLEIAEEALDLAREQYRLGTFSFTDLQTQVEQQRAAQVESITAAYAFHDALLNLETAVGGPVVAEGDGPASPLDEPR